MIADVLVHRSRPAGLAPTPHERLEILVAYRDDDIQPHQQIAGAGFQRQPLALEPQYLAALSPGGDLHLDRIAERRHADGAAERRILERQIDDGAQILALDLEDGMALIADSDQRIARLPAEL